MSYGDIDLSQTPEGLSEQQQQAIADFKKDIWKLPDGTTYEPAPVEEYLKWDWTACRFLTARDWNVSKAQTMFKEHLKTRREMNMPDLIENFTFTDEELRAVEKYCPLYWAGTDREGRPILVQCFTPLDGDKLFAVVPEERVLRCQAYTCEVVIKDILPAASKEVGRPVRHTISIIDFGDVSYSQLFQARGFAKKFLTFQEANYPNYLGKSYVINAPTTLKVVWEMAEKLLPKATAAKVSILGTDYQDAINKDIAAEALPKAYGGTRTDVKTGPPTVEAILGHP